MAYILIGAALLLILGPILMLRPSPNDKRLEGIRTYAMSEGVMIAPLSVSNKKYLQQLERNPHLEGYRWFKYELMSDQNSPKSLPKGIWRQRKNREGDYLWEAEQIIQEVPDSLKPILRHWEQDRRAEFLLLEIGNRSAVIVWNEQGDIDTSKEVCGWLKSLVG